ncbi:hypothetical protein [Mycoplasma yeatsii]|uniref:hypothetical protein n=1 Tax=Mycoplasma yeatsii TaxID=51365 RepID=UPI0005B24C48|nr:hypothetical protein [Mycoplasma yeatsii]AJM71707.1 hypothetical protein MYE_01090 [Mycoplasma yeatsii GM274B]
MNRETSLFPIVEIRHHSIKFEVIRFYKNQVVVVYENTYYGDGSEILTSQGVVKESNIVSKFLEQNFNTIELKFKNLKLRDVGLVLPNNISIIRKNIHCDLTQQDTSKLKNSVSLNLIMKKSAKLHDPNKISQNIKILDNKIYELFVDNQKVDLNQLDNINMNGKDVTIVSSIITIDKTLYESHEKTLTKIGKKVLWAKPKIFALHEMVSDKKNPFKIIVDWRYNEIEIGLFRHNILSKIVRMPFGVEKILYEVSQFMDIDLNLASKYVFNNIDFGSDNLKDIKVFSRWNKKTKSLDIVTADKLKEIVNDKIIEMYQEIKDSIIDSTSEEYDIYNFGSISNIPGVKSLVCLTNRDYICGQNWIGDFIMGGDSCSLIGLATFANRNIANNADELYLNEDETSLQTTTIVDKYFENKNKSN